MSLTISAPAYTPAPKTSLAFYGECATYTVVPAHKTTHQLLQPQHESSEEASDHMLHYVSGLWAQDWDNPEDSVYDEW